MNFSWIDIVIVVILLASAVRGLSEGFVKSFLSFFLIIGGLVLAKIFSQQLADYVSQNSHWVSQLHGFVSDKLTVIFGGSAVSGASWTNSSQLYNVPVSLQNLINNFVSTADKTVGDVTAILAQNISDFLVLVICFLAIFLAILIVGNILIFVLDKLTSLPVLKTFNKAGGLLVGLLKGAIICCLFATILYFANLMLGAVTLSTAINNSFLIKYFYLGFLFG
ncbi:MAG: CvpA family protein [Anaerofustis sp.]